MRLTTERLHEFEKEVFQKKTEIAEIQKILSDSHLAVFDERRQILRL